MRRQSFTAKALAALLLSAPLGAGAITNADAKTFKWAADSDPGSMDPYSRNVASTLSMLSNIYEPLIRRDKDLKLSPGLATEWMRISVRFTAARAPEIGSRLTDSIGRVIVQIFVPQGLQVGRARQLVDFVRDTFQQQVIGGAHLYETQPTFSGPDPQGQAYWMETVETRFRFESVPA